MSYDDCRCKFEASATAKEFWLYKKTALGFPQRGTDALHREKVADRCKTKGGIQGSSVRPRMPNDR